MPQVLIVEQVNLKDVSTSRRDFLKQSIKFLPFIGVGAFLYPAYKYASFEEKAKISLAIPLTQLDKNISKFQKVLIKKEGKDIIVYSAHCTHMGCVLNIDEKKQRFVCPCHQSEFSFDGKRLKGPAQKDLVIIDSRVENNILYIG